jgi:Tfp pilus assembly PilM family ATPase
VGGEAGNVDTLRLLADQVNVPLQVGRPVRNIGTDGGGSGADRRSGQPEWATAVGLALKPIPAEAQVA